MNIRTDLPKMYRVVYAKIEWITDTLEGGEHVQRCGDYYSQVRRVITPNGWKWQALWKNDVDYHWYQWLDETPWTGYEDDVFEWVVKAPTYLDEDELMAHKIACAKPEFKSIKERDEAKLESEEFNLKFNVFCGTN